MAGHMATVAGKEDLFAQGPKAFADLFADVEFQDSFTPVAGPVTSNVSQVQ